MIGTRVGLVAAVWLTCACSPDAPSVLDPRGPAAERIAGLWWLMLWISAAVCAAVTGMIAFAIVRGRRATSGEPSRAEVRWGEPFIVVSGVVVTVLVLAAVFVVSLRDMRALASRGARARLVVDVIAHDWWWEARYPNGAVTANEIHMPAGEPVRFRLRTADVIHSFWVPQLGPKIDMVPGRTNEVWLEAARPGRYRGQCAEYCGLQHANMAVFVIADEPARFDRWLAEQARPAVAGGNAVFLEGTCAGCHAVRGTSATAEAGPDLTHLASRETIAAGTLPNTPGNLAAFIVGPHRIKPGVVMPPTQLSAEDLDALVTYLGTLR